MVPLVGLWCVIVVFPDHIYLHFRLILISLCAKIILINNLSSTTAESRAKIWYQ